MNRTILLTAALIAAGGISALTAQAQETTTPSQLPMSIVQIATMLEGQGYTVHEIELEHGRYEVEMIDGNGMRVEAYLNAVTGEALPYMDDDDHKDDDDDRDDD